MYKCIRYLTLSAISCFFACFVLAFPLPADAILINLAIRTRDKQIFYLAFDFVVNKNIYWRTSKGGKPDFDEKSDPDAFKTFFCIVYTHSYKNYPKRTMQMK